MRSASARTRKPIGKAPTGIAGFDKITGGGIPRGRITLVCGGPGTGKTVFALETLVRGAMEHGEPGVFVSFEAPPHELEADVASLGWDIRSPKARRLIRIEHVEAHRNDLRMTGELDLEGLFIRLDHAIRAIGARRVALDTLETLFSAIPARSALREELGRLFRWLKERGMTTVLTAESGGKLLTRDEIEEYAADCVIRLDQRVVDDVATRRLRIVKYRGSRHETNEFPFVIDEDGFSVVPITGSRLDHAAPRKRISSGLRELDAMLGRRGFYRQSSILVSGTAGTGKTTLAGTFLDAACARGERCVYFSFEEAPATLVRDLAAVGIDLGRWEREGRLLFESSRPTTEGLEMHIAEMARAVRRFRPTVAVVDPISSFEHIAPAQLVKNMTTLLSDMFRAAGVTVLMTYLAHPEKPEMTGFGISSTMDVWIALRTKEGDGATGQVLRVVKSRGIDNARDARPYRITPDGIRLEPRRQR